MPYMAFVLFSFKPAVVTQMHIQATLQAQVIQASTRMTLTVNMW